MVLYPLPNNPRGTLEYPIETSELPDNVGFLALWPSVIYIEAPSLKMIKHTMDKVAAFKPILIEVLKA